MPLIQVIVALMLIGIVLWAINRFIPMAESIKTILNIVVVGAVVFWLLNLLEIISHFPNIRVGM